MRYSFIITCLCFCCALNAQRKVTYTGSAEGGLLKGSASDNGFLVLTNGISYRQLSLTAGTGYDFYRFRTIPVFIESKKVFTNKNIRPFLQAAAGINLHNLTNSNKATTYNFGGTYKNGAYLKTGCGILFYLQKRVHFLVNAGYCYKTVSYKYNSTSGEIYSSNSQESIYHFNRWYFGTGIMW